MADKDEPKQNGRPSGYTQKIADTICEMMADGMSVREICAMDDMPSKSMVFRWLGQHESFRDRYARACEARSEHMADEILDIADNAQNDYMERMGDDDKAEGWRENGEAMQRSKLRIDSRKWLLAKLQPTKYGERITQDINAKVDITTTAKVQDDIKSQFSDDSKS